MINDFSRFLSSVQFNAQEEIAHYASEATERKRIFTLWMLRGSVAIAAGARFERQFPGNGLSGTRSPSRQLYSMAELNTQHSSCNAQ